MFFTKKSIESIVKESGGKGSFNRHLSATNLIAFASVCISIMILRKTQPDAPHPFRTPYLLAVPLMGAFIYIVQILLLPDETWARLLVWIALGTTIYFLHGRRHCKLKRKKDSAS